jgi:UDP-N-acetyl-D-galactosamine dehydrogenase
VAKKVVQHIIKNEQVVSTAKVLVMGATFKENVSDIRNSKVAELVKEFLGYSLVVDFYDPHASAAEVEKEYGLAMVNEIGNEYDAVVLAVGHEVFKNYTEEFYVSITRRGALFADLKGLYRNKISKLNYWSL